MKHHNMTWEHTVQSKRAARENALDAALRCLPPDIADSIDLEGLHGQTLIAKIAGGEVTAEQVAVKAIHK